MKQRSHILLMILAVLSGLLFASGVGAQAVTDYYVKATGGDDGNDGRSWDAAFATLQKALEEAADGATIRVAEGTYTGPFTMKEGVTVLGGYPAGATDAITTDADRRLPGSGENLATLEGGGSDRVLTQSLAFAGVTLWEGFVLTGGNTDDMQWGGGGAFLLGNGILRNCIVQGNTSATRGGGIYAGKDARVEGCLVTGNTASDGAGIYVAGGTVLNCTVVDNTLTGTTPLSTPPEIGNYYYADGSWSATLDEQKDLAGIVCTIYPFNKYTGLILHVGENSLATWQSAKDWAEGITAGGFDDWRLPGIRELQDIYIEKDKLNLVLNNLQKTELSTEIYWSGSESVGGDAWGVKFGNGGVGFHFKDNLGRARAVRSF